MVAVGEIELEQLWTAGGEALDAQLGQIDAAAHIDAGQLRRFRLPPKCNQRLVRQQQAPAQVHVQQCWDLQHNLDGEGGRGGGLEEAGRVEFPEEGTAFERTASDVLVSLVQLRSASDCSRLNDLNCGGGGDERRQPYQP